MIRFLLCAAFPALPGLGLARLKKERESITLAECYLYGLLFLFLLGEIASCAAIKMERGFSFYCGLFAGFAVTGSLLLLIPGGKTAGEALRLIRERFTAPKEKNRNRKRQAAETVILLLLLGMQIAGYFLYIPDTGGDTMTETISVAVLTDTIFRYDPVTGKLLANGMYPLFKLASLPLLYGGVYKLSGMEMQDFLYCAVPIWMLLVNYAVLRVWSCTLFREQKEKRNLFLIFANLLILMGDNGGISYAHDLLHHGWRSTTMAMTVFLIGAWILFEMLVKKEWACGVVGTALALCGFLAAYPLLPPDLAAAGYNRQWDMLLIAALGLYLVRECTKKKWKKQEVILIGVCLLLSAAPGLPFAVLGISYALTGMWSVADEWKRGVVMFAGLLIVICMTGTVLPFRADLPKRWHIPESSREIQDKIAQVAETYEGEARLAAPSDVMEKARLADARIVLPYGKDLWNPGCNREIRNFYPYEEEALLLYEQMKTDYAQPDTAAALAAAQECNILVLRERMSTDAMRQYGWRETENITGYAVYYR